ARRAGRRDDRRRSPGDGGVARAERRQPERMAEPRARRGRDRPANARLRAAPPDRAAPRIGARRRGDGRAPRGAAPRGAGRRAAGRGSGAPGGGAGGGREPFLRDAGGGNTPTAVLSTLADLAAPFDAREASAVREILARRGDLGSSRVVALHASGREAV